VKAGGPNKFKMGGTGSKQEDQIITVAIEKASGVKFTYVPFKGGGDVAVQLVGKHIDSSVNNPIEAVAQWRGGKLRPLCVFDAQPMAYDEPIADGKSWKDIPTWYLIAEQDRMIVPETQRFMAERMKANIRTLAVDHTPSVTAPAAVADIIRDAVRAVSGN